MAIGCVFSPEAALSVDWRWWFASWWLVACGGRLLVEEDAFVASSELHAYGRLDCLLAESPVNDAGCRVVVSMLDGRLRVALDVVVSCGHS